MDQSPLGMVAGAGRFPVDLAHRCRSEGRAVFVIRFAGISDDELDAFPGLSLPLGRLGALISSLKAAGCRRLMFCGKVMRPAWKDLKLDWVGFKCILAIVARGWGRDDALQRVIAQTLERDGIRIVGPAEIWPDILAPAGLLTTDAPGEADWVDIRAAGAKALEVGRADLGQAAIARSGQVIAVEDRGHTDGLLRRVAGMGGQGGVLVKLAKPQQDRRLDLPVVGPPTVALAAAAGLSGIVVQSGATIIIQREDMVAAAAAAGLFIYAMDPEALG